MDIEGTIHRPDRLSAPNLRDSNVQSDVELAAIAQSQAEGANYSTGDSASVPKASEDAPPGVEPVAGPIYGHMTKPNPEATVGRATQIVSYLTSTARHASSGFAASIRRDPWSAAVVGVGLGCLVLQWWTQRGVRTRSSTRALNDAQSLGRAVSGSILTRLRPATATSESQITGMAQCLADVAGARAQQFSERVQQLGSEARGRADDLSGEIQETVHNLGDEAQDHLSDMSNNAQGQVNRLRSDVQEASQRLTGSIEKALRQNLVAASAIGPSLMSATGPVATEAALVGQKLERAVLNKRS